MIVDVIIENANVNMRYLLFEILTNFQVMGTARVNTLSSNKRIDLKGITLKKAIPLRLESPIKS